MRLPKRSRSLGGIDQVVQRPHEQHGIGALVPERQVPSVPTHDGQSRPGGKTPHESRRLVEVVVHRFDQGDAVPSFCKVACVNPWTAAHVDDGASWRQVAIEDVPGPQPNQIAYTGDEEAPRFSPAVVEVADPAVQSSHNASLAPFRHRCPAFLTA